MRQHLADGAFLANAGGLAVNLFGTATSDQLVQVVGSSLSIGSLLVAWLLTTRRRIADDNRELARQEREEKRHQDQLDAMQKLDLLIRERQARELPVDQLQPVDPLDTRVRGSGCEPPKMGVLRSFDPPVYYVPDARPSG